MIQRPLVLLAALAVAPLVFAQSGVLDVLQVDYVRETTSPDGRKTITEEGTYFLGPDGTYRVDRINKRNNSHTAQIEKLRERISLNLDTYEARVVLRSSGSGPIDNTPIPAPGQPSVQIIPQPWKQEFNGLVPLGTKTIGELTLVGHRSTTVLNRGNGSETLILDSWVFHPPQTDPRTGRRLVPIIMETRHQSPNGSIDEQRIVTVARIKAVEDDLFAIPSNFKVVQ